MMKRIKKWLGIQPSIAERNRKSMEELGSYISAGIREGLGVPPPPSSPAEFDRIIKEIKRNPIVILPEHQQTVDIPNDLEINGHPYTRVVNKESHNGKVNKYRKKPVVIEALQYDGSNMQEIKEFITDSDALKYDGLYYIRTLEGDMNISMGDFIIKGVQGEFYPCKPDIFYKSYEKE